MLNLCNQLSAECYRIRNADDRFEMLEEISDDQAQTAIQEYCYSKNPDLKNMVNDDQYTVYWEVSSSEENEVVILFRSYTGALNYYYIDRNTGDVYVTECVPGIIDEEQKTDESFNIKDY